MSRYNYEEFKSKYLIKELTDNKGRPKHTRHVKGVFYTFAKQLKEEFKFDMFTCSECGCTEHNSRPVIMEMDHLNRDTSDSRIENLSMKCPNCHSQTLGYKNRTIAIEDYFYKLKTKSDKKLW